MRKTKRFLQFLLGSLAMSAFAVLAGSSAEQAQTPTSSAVASFKVFSSKPTLVSGKPMVGNTAVAETPKLAIGSESKPKVQWYACDSKALASDSLDPNCEPIPGANQPSLEFSNAEVGKHVLYAMSFGSGPIAFSATTEAAVLPAPTLSATPTGLNKSLRFTSAKTPTQNSKITVTRGAWPTTDAGYTVTYSWLRCQNAVTASDVVPEGCVPIDGAAAANYTVTADDIGYRIVSHVTATLGDVTSEIWTNSIGPVYKAIKYYSGAGIAAGTGSYPYLVGFPVTPKIGTWDGPPKFTYQWYSCTAKVAGAATLNKLCKAIAGATKESYTPTTAVNGKYLMVKLAGSTPLATTVITTYSASSTKVLDDPTNTKPPTIPATAPIVGNSVAVTAGVWAGSPAPVKTYRWYSCETEESVAGADKPEDCTAIDGATATSYVVPQNQYGKFLLVEEIATSLAGTDSIFTATTAAVVSRPVFAGDPDVTGVAEIGQEYLATAGTGADSLQETVEYQWLSCSVVSSAAASKPSTCQVIPNATSAVYVATRAVEGSYLAVQVTLGNTVGKTVRVSATASEFLKSAPLLEDGVFAPTGAVTVGTSVPGPSGLWRGAPAPSFVYQWYLCDLENTRSASVSTDCLPIAGATAASFTPTHAQAAGFLRLKVIATNSMGTFTVVSGTSQGVKERPSFIGSPVITTDAFSGTAITVSETAANGVPSPDRTIAWYQCKNAVLTPSLTVPTTASCVVIPGQTGTSYTPTNADLDKYIAAFVTSTNSIGSASYFTATSTVIRGAPSIIGTIAAPGVSGTNPRVGVAINGPNSTWVGSPTPAKSIQWFSCAAENPTITSDFPDTCAEITGATGTSFTPTVNEVDRYLLVRVTAANSVGSVSRYTATTLPVLEVPNFVVDPTISGGKLQGSDLVIDELFTRGSPLPKVAYSWYRCVAALTTVQATTTCEKIAGATGISYTLTAADLDKFISAGVSLSSDLGTVQKISISSAKIQGAPALVGTLVAPVAGAVRVDSAITMADTTWTGSPAVTKAYQWFSCPVGFASASSTIDSNCTSISGATSLKFTPTIAEVGRFLAVKVVASNTIGTVTKYTPSTTVVNELPSFQGDVTLDDVNLVGSKVTATLPAFRGFPIATPTYAWYRCPTVVSWSAASIPTTCGAITGATSSSYVLDVADLDKFVVAGVTLTNSSGSAIRYSPSTVSILGLPKLTNTLGLASSSLANVKSPRIGVLENAPTNSWAGSPKPTVALQWLRCDDVTSQSSNEVVPCDEIPGATAATYTPTIADKGFALRVRITATNTLGTTTIWSGTTLRTQQAPSFGAEPKLSDTIVVDDLLRVNAVTQVAYPTATETYEWWRCPVAVPAGKVTLPATCSLIMNETVSTHTLLSTDAENYIVAKVTLTNEAGSASKFTASTAQIISRPKFVNEPTVTGQSYVTGLLLLKPFTVSAKPKETLSYQWYYCSTKYFVSLETPSDDCFPIAGATGATYTPVVGDVGRYISVLVTATNTAGSQTSFSETTSAILMPPQNVVAPQVTGTTVISNNVQTDSGQWTPATGVTFDYKWFACNKSVPAASDTISTVDCAVVPNATGNKFTLTAAQVGKYMVSAVTAKNFTINVVKYSASSEIIADYPIYTSGMAVTLPAGEGSDNGAPRVGYKVAAVDGVWAGTPAPSFTYQWFVCGAARTAADKTFATECREIRDATAKEFRITPELATDYQLVGKYLGVKVTGANKAGTDFAYSVTSAKTVTLPPQMDTAPEVTGYRYVDGVLTSSKGTFHGTPATSETQAWWQCPAAIPVATSTQPAGCTSITGATAGTLKLTLAMKGKFVTSATTSKNEAGTLVVWAQSLVEVTTGAINTVPPTIGVDPVGIPQVGGTLTANHGTWSGDPALTEASYTYQWYSCATEVKAASYTLSLDLECIRVGDAVNTQYVPSKADAGRYILVSVTGTNSNGGSTIYSPSTSIVKLKPENLTVPVITGTAFVGLAQTSSPGTWTAIEEAKYTYQWLLCDTEQTVAPSQQPADCTEISLAKAASYTPLISQVGQFLMVKVTATNSAGALTVFSLTSPEIKSAPINKTAPVVVISNGTNGLPVANQSTLSTTGGVWQGRPAPTFEFQWFSCAVAITAGGSEPAEDKDCRAVTEKAEGMTYSPDASDRGRFIAVKVFAKNIHAVVVHWSAATSVVNMAPVKDVAPSIAGAIFVQSTVTARGDTWTAYPKPTDTYQWLYCTELKVPAACTPIAGASAATFTIPANLEGKALIVKVTASNAFGSDVNYSTATVDITPGPVSTSAHVITGSIAYPPVAGAVLTTNDGTWAGNPRPTLEYQWYRCSKTGLATTTLEIDPSCVAIEGATSNTYGLVDADPGSALIVGITGTNSFGTSTRFSAATAIVTEKVRLITSPALTGRAKIDQEISADEGVWRGFPSPTTVYSWYSCTTATPANPVQIPAASGVGVVPPVGCTKIVGAVNKTFSVSASHLGKMLIFMVTKSNIVDGVTTTVNAYTQSSLPAAQPPVSLAKPSISSPGAVSGANPKVGSVWSVSTGLWADPQPIKTYQWYRCESSLATGPTPITELPAEKNCVAISGATATSYTVVAEDSGKYLAIEAIATNAADTLHQWSNSTQSVLQVPIAIVPPTVSGDRQRGKVLTADPGTWTGSPTPVISYQWYTCKNSFAGTTTTPQPATNCSPITSETEATYTQSTVGSDDGKFITVTVSGTSGTAEPTVYWVQVGANDATAMAPIVTALPSIYSKSGTAAVGEVFTIEDHTWQAAPAPTFTYKWYHCKTANIAASSTLDVNCEVIAGETASSYTATLAQANDTVFPYLMGSVTATNGVGSATAYSKSYSTAIDKGIVNTKPMGITAASLLVPTSVSWTTGEWTSNYELRITHKWLTCSVAFTQVLSYIPNECEVISTVVETNPAAPTPLNITPESELSGSYISLYEKVEQKVDTTWRRVRERVTVTTGALAEAPALRTGAGFKAPSVDLDMVVGYESTAKPGDWVRALTSETSYTWRGSPVGTFAYQWFSCKTRQLAYTATTLPAGCDYITGTQARPTNQEKLAPLESEIGQFIGVRITANNASGSSVVWTNTSLAVTQEVTNITPPTLGTAYIVGERLTLTGGTALSWKGTPAPSVVVDWFYCSSPHTVAEAALPADCKSFVNGTAAPNEGIDLPLERSEGTQYLMAKVTGTNTAWVNGNKATSISLFSPTSKRIMSPPYIKAGDIMPATTGLANVGATLSLSSGSWSGTPFINTQGRWFACETPVTASKLDTVATGCTLFKSKTQNIALTHAQVGKYIVGQIVSTNDAGTTYQSAASTQIVLEAPTIVSPSDVTLVDAPLPSGKIEVGQKVSYTAATWDGAPAPSATYKFYVCPSANPTAGSAIPTGCVAATGVTGNTLTLVDAHAGQYIVVVSTATNTIYGSGGTKVSASTNSVSASLGPIYRTPYFEAAAVPAITGTMHVGSLLSFSKAAVKGFETPVSTYDWYACDTTTYVAASCALLTGKSNAALEIPQEAAGKYVVGVQTASATWTSTTATKSTTATTRVTSSPYVITAPTTAGDRTVGSTVKLTVDKGVWGSTPAITDDSKYSISWLQCEQASAAGVTPTTCGATALQTYTANAPLSYTLTAAQAGKYLVARVTATASTNKSATDSVIYYTAAVGPILQAPTLPGTPTITGGATPDVGSTLSMVTTTPGGFPVNTPTYKWYVCSATTAGTLTSVPGNCVEQTTFDTKAFTLPASAAGGYVLGWVTATNEVGSVSKATAFTPIVKMAAVNTAVPVLSGSDEVGGTITATSGSWTSTPAATYTYQWHVCETADAAVSACSALGSSASANTFTPAEAQAGKYILVNVTATTAVWAGNKLAVKPSATFGPIRMPATIKTAPSITGVAHADQTLSLALPGGSVVGFPAPRNSYQWFQCETSVPTPVTTLPANCELIPGADNNPLVLQSSAAGKFIIAMLKSVNYSTAYRSTVSTAAVTETLVNVTAPELTGDLWVGGAGVSASAGTWTSTPAVNPSTDISYIFYTCATATWAANCDVVTTANNKVAKVAPTSAMQGKYLIAKVTATVAVNKSGTGSITKTTNAIGPIEAAPSFTSVPTISGTFHVGSDVTASVTGELGVPAPAKSYAWYICNAAVTANAADMPAGCSPVDSAIDGNATLKIPSDAAGLYVAAKVMLGNTRGDVSAITLTSTVVTATPTNTVAPAIGGDDIFATGKNVTVTTGTWVTAPATATKAFSYSWYACPTAISAVANCAYLGDTATGIIATSETMVDKFVIAKVTVTVAVNKTGAGVVSVYTSNASNRIRKSAVFGSAPQVTGNMHIGETLTAGTGNPTGVPAPTVSYAWYVCPAAVPASVTTAPTNCVLNSSAGNTFTIPAAAAGSYVIALVKASSDTDLATVYKSSVSNTAVSSPAVLGATTPAITGSAVLGSAALSVSNGTWSWKPSTATAIYSYKWYTCTSTVTFTGGSALPDLCSVIANQTSSTLTLTTATLGYKILAEVDVTVPTNLPVASVTKYFTAVTAVVMSKPAPGTTPPSMGYTSLTANSVVTAKLGTWSGSPTPLLSATWYTCPAATTLAAGAKTAPATCTALTVKGDLTILSSYKGLKLLLLVVASNDAGTASNISSLLAIP